jgi:monovalent cation/proton antiporter MnhG/PhaG subunit
VRVAAVVLLTLGVGATLICCLGIVAMRSTYDRLHYASAIGTVGPALILAAVIVQEGLSSGALKAVVAVIAVGLTGPVLSHAIGRAARIREGGRPDHLPSEERS